MTDTWREWAVQEGKLEDMTFGAWMHLLKFEFMKSGKMTSREANNYIQSIDESVWRESYDGGYGADDIAIDELSCMEEK